MSETIIECVPNFSEGRDADALREIVSAIDGVSSVKILDVDRGSDTNRTVVTFIGSPEDVEEAAFRGVVKAAHLIDMREHQGEHPRVGAIDVLPFVPISGITMDDCVVIANRVGKRIGEELGIPVFLYDHAATHPGRCDLSEIRSGEYEGMGDKLKDPYWNPDFGPRIMNPKSGVTCVGARELLIAYNINLNSMDIRCAEDIAYTLRERGRWKRIGNITPLYYKGEVVYFPGDGTYPCGPCDFVGKDFEDLEIHYRGVHGRDLGDRYEKLGINPKNPSGPVFDDGLFKNVRAIGWVIDEYEKAQISINVTDFKVSPLHEIFEATREEAHKRGISVTGSELIGLVPFEALFQAGTFYQARSMESEDISTVDLLELAVESMGLRDVSSFDLKKKLISIPSVVEKALSDSSGDKKGS